MYNLGNIFGCVALGTSCLTALLLIMYNVVREINRDKFLINMEIIIMSSLIGILVGGLVTSIAAMVDILYGVR